MLCPFLPQFRCCCFCVKNLTVACVYIIIWSDLVLIHIIRILLWPKYADQYQTSGIYYEPLIYLKWFLFGFCLSTILCGFLFLLGLFLPKMRFACDIYVFSALVTSLLLLAQGIFTIINIFEQKVCSVTDGSDGVIFIIYSIVWFYFLVIVNSYSIGVNKRDDYEDTTDTIAEI